MTAPPRGHWKLLPHFLLRRAGFPFSALEAIALTRTAGLAKKVAELGESASLSRTRLLGTLFPAEVTRCAGLKDKVALKALSRWLTVMLHELALCSTYR